MVIININGKSLYSIPDFSSFNKMWEQRKNKTIIGINQVGVLCILPVVKNAGISNILQWYGKNSLVVLSFHIIELDLIPAAIILQKLKSFGISAFLSMLILIIIKIIWVSMGIVIVHHISFLKRIFFTNSQ